jgi:NAD(P)H-dependent flavin oxidoreductase YrpB (nitropropane dioxygenase family)
MGVGVSNWSLANAVARCGQLGVVSGTVLDTLLVRRLAAGDPGGAMRRAMARFPLPGVTEEVLKRYFRPEGLAPGETYPLLPMWRQTVSHFRQQVAMLAAFVEVSLAREGHDGPIGMNLLTKVQLPNLATLYGAMLAGVDVILMGAGIPREIPGVLDQLARHERVELRLDVDGLPVGSSETFSLDPSEHWPPSSELRRPIFLPIISANSLATTLARKSNGRVDGFVVEGPTAGGHNAPPRGALTLDERGEPIYGERDIVDLEKLAELGLPFWVAGGAGTPDALARARSQGARGVQVGTLFAFCDESGVDPCLKASVLTALLNDGVRVATDPRASPTGYPFKVVHVEGDGAADALATRPRKCDLGYLRTAYVQADGRLGYRCPAEPVDDYIAKGGTIAETEGRHCLCNGLLATIGHGQRREEGLVEPPFITSGSDLEALRTILDGRSSYRAADVVAWVTGAPVPITPLA